MSQTYRDRGVSAAKEDVHAAVREAAAGLFPGAFCKIVPDVSGDDDHVALLHADGAGTKAIVAYLRYKESGSPEAFEGIAQDSAVMNIDDMLCVGAVDGFLLSNTIGRNAHRVDGSVLAAIVGGYESFVRTMAEHGVTIRTAGGETADVGDLVQTVIVDSTVYTRMRRDDVIDASRMKVGDVIVGLSSTGQATYESQPGSGIGSNGLTLARHLLIHPDYARRYPESYSPTLEPQHVYGGRFHLDDPLPGAEGSVGWGLLSPTRTYAPIIKRILAEHRPSISALIHCTGGGQTKCLSFARGLHFIKDDLFDVPPLFRVIAEDGKIEDAEMHEVFNMGHRMEVYCDTDAAAAIVAIAAEFDVDARVVGRVEAHDSAAENRLTIVRGGADLEFRKERPGGA